MAELLLREPGALPRVVGILTTCLEKITASNDVYRPVKRLRQRGSSFDMIIRPDRAVRGFLARLSERLPSCSPQCYVLAFIYLDHFLSRRSRSINLDSFNVRRIFATSLLIAAKIMHGRLYNNGDFSNVARIKLKDMNKLEWEFLEGIDFRLNAYAEFDIYCMILLLRGPKASSNSSEITQPIPSATAPSNSSEITQPIPSASAPSTLSLPCCLYVQPCDCSKEKPLE